MLKQFSFLFFLIASASRGARASNNLRRRLETSRTDTGRTDLSCEVDPSPSTLVYNLITTNLNAQQVYLSTTNDGRQVDLFSHDDYSGRQKWAIEPVDGTTDTFYIVVGGGVSGIDSNPQRRRRYLSTAPDGRVDLYFEDDDTGRQKWILKEISGFEGYYTLSVQGGTNDGVTYLSGIANADFTTVSVAGEFQKSAWQLVRTTCEITMAPTTSPAPSSAPTDVSNVCEEIQSAVSEDSSSNNGNLYNINLGARDDSATPSFLSASINGRVVRLENADDGSGRQKWLLEHVSEDLYNIRVADGVVSQRQYLSAIKTTAESEEDDGQLGDLILDINPRLWRLNFNHDGSDAATIRSLFLPPAFDILSGNAPTGQVALTPAGPFNNEFPKDPWIITPTSCGAVKEEAPAPIQGDTNREICPFNPGGHNLYYIHVEDDDRYLQEHDGTGRFISIASFTGSLRQKWAVIPTEEPNVYNIVLAGGVRNAADHRNRYFDGSEDLQQGDSPATRWILDLEANSTIVSKQNPQDPFFTQLFAGNLNFVLQRNNNQRWVFTPTTC